MPFESERTGIREGASVEVAEPDAKVRKRTAPRYKVLIHDDPITPMDAVVVVLTRVFAKQEVDATRIMRRAHERGLALVEIVSLEVAEFHVDRAHSLARGWGWPLTFTIESA